MSVWDIAEIQGQTQSSVRGGGSDVILNYTLIMDDAPGPSIIKEELQLTVKPNPVIIKIQGGSRVYSIGSKDTIAITVSP